MAKRIPRQFAERVGPTTVEPDTLGDGRDTVVVTLHDDQLHEPLADLRWRLDAVLATGASTLIVDVGDVTRLSSATVAVLLWVSRRCRARGVRMVLRAPSRSSVEFLRRTGLLSRLETMPPVMDSAAAPRRAYR